MGKKAIIAIFVLILLLIYPSWKIHEAKKRITHLSQQITIGMPIKEVYSLAKKLELKINISEDNSTKSQTLIIWDGWAFAKWTCFVDHESGKVLKKEVLFLD